jgi:NTE family protein
VSGLKVFPALEYNFSFETFEELNKPFAAVATDLYSGREVNFMSGSVVEAVKASCAIPGLFPPLLFENRWLVDGGVVNPVPVNMCRILGADIVIAVNLSADFRPQSLVANPIDHGNNQKKTSDFFKLSQQQIQQWFKKDGDVTTNATEQDIITNQEFLTEECLEILESADVEQPKHWRYQAKIISFCLLPHPLLML